MKQSMVPNKHAQPTRASGGSVDHDGYGGRARRLTRMALARSYKNEEQTNEYPKLQFFSPHRDSPAD